MFKRAPVVNSTLAHSEMKFYVQTPEPPLQTNSVIAVSDTSVSAWFRKAQGQLKVSDRTPSTIP